MLFVVVVVVAVLLVILDFICLLVCWYVMGRGWFSKPCKIGCHIYNVIDFSRSQKVSSKLSESSQSVSFVLMQEYCWEEENKSLTLTKMSSLETKHSNKYLWGIHFHFYHLSKNTIFLSENLASIIWTQILS